MLKHLLEFLTFSNKERNGILILLIILGVVILSPSIILISKKTIPIDGSEFEKEIQGFEESIQMDTLGGMSNDFVDRTNIKDPHGSIALPDPFYFDPNTLSAEGWNQLGVPKRVVNTLTNYLEKGGRFYRKEDLTKIYGFPKVLYERLFDYILIPADENADLRKGSPITIPVKIEINHADLAGWKQLKGIGEVLSGRILKYRNALGGFYRVEQLLDVYGIDSILFTEIMPFLEVDDSMITHININEVEYLQLVKHPYISKQLANWIIAYKDQHGNYQNIIDIKVSYLVDEKLYHKIQPYLTIR